MTQQAIDTHAGKCTHIVNNWRSKKSGEVRCQNPALRNGFCTRHQNIISKSAAVTIAKYEQVGERKKISPVAALTTLLEEAAGNVEFYRAEVTKLQKLVIVGRKEREEVAKMVVLYNEERDRLEQYTLDAIRVRLDERQIQLYDFQSQAMVKVIKAIVDGLQLMGETRAKALEIAATHLELIAAQKINGWAGPLNEAEKIVEDQAVAR